MTPRAAGSEFRSITFGDQLLSFQLGGFQFTETWHPAGAVLHKHSHADASINFVISGQVRETVGNIAHHREYDCRAGSLLYKATDEHHANVYGSKGARCLIVQPSAQTLESLASAGYHADGDPFPLDPRPAQIVGQIYAEVRQGDDLSPLGIEAAALTLVALLSRRPQRRGTPAWLMRATEYLSDNGRRPVRLREVAVALGVDPTELSRTFRRVYGMTPSDFVRRRRTRWAAARLSDGEDRLSAIALCAGFVDQSHFARTFRAHYGLTPNRYRALTARR